MLLAVARIGEDAYGVSIARTIEEASQQPMAIASVYRAVQRLEEKGLVKTALGESTPERGGRAKRLVRITQDGKWQALQTRRTLQRLGFAYET